MCTRASVSVCVSARECVRTHPRRKKKRRHREKRRERERIRNGQEKNTTVPPLQLCAHPVTQTRTRTDTHAHAQQKNACTGERGGGGGEEECAPRREFFPRRTRLKSRGITRLRTRVRVSRDSCKLHLLCLFEEARARPLRRRASDNGTHTHPRTCARRLPRHQTRQKPSRVSPTLSLRSQSLGKRHSYTTTTSRSHAQLPVCKRTPASDDCAFA